MTDHKKKSFSAKHGNGLHPDNQVSAEIKAHVIKNRLSCTAAFSIAKKLNVTPAEVGKTTDLLNYKLVECQLGLFGYPSGKTVEPLESVEAELADAIRAGLENGYLACKSAWSLADHFNISRRSVSDACEALKIKIKPCQLGAF